MKVASVFKIAVLRYATYSEIEFFLEKLWYLFYTNMSTSNRQKLSFLSPTFDQILTNYQKSKCKGSPHGAPKSAYSHQKMAHENLADKVVSDSHELPKLQPG